MRRWVFPIVFLFVTILFSGYHYSEKFKIRTLPPSNEWSKGVFVSKGNITTYPRIIEYGEGYVAAHNDGSSIKVIKLGKLGEVKKEKYFGAVENDVTNIVLLTNGNEIYLSWIGVREGSRVMRNLELDGELNIQKSYDVEEVLSSDQIGGSIKLTAYKNRIEITNIKDNKIYAREASQPMLVTGTKVDEGYMVAYYENKKSFNYFFIRNGNMSEVKNAGNIGETGRMLINRAVVSNDGKYGYILVEIEALDLFRTCKLISFELDGEYRSVEQLRIFPEKGNIYNYEYILHPLNVSSGTKGARFFVEYERGYLKSTQFDILDFTINDRKIEKNNYMSNTWNASMYPGSSGSMAIYCDYISDKNYEVYISSSDTGFKTAHNGVRPNEIRLAISDTITSIVNSMLNVFAYALKWVVPSGIVVSLITLFGYRIKCIRNKKIAFIMACIICTLIKVLTVFSTFNGMYKQNIYGFLKYSVISMATLILISALAFAYGYGIYVSQLGRDADILPAPSITTALIIDSLLTQLAFIPLIL